MGHLQQPLLNWVAHQPGLTGLVIFAAGLISAFYGFRVSRFLIMVYGAALGYMGGLALAGVVDWPELAAASAAALVGGGAALAWPKPGVVILSGATWALLGMYVTTSIGLKGLPVWIALGLLGLAGFLLAILNRKTMTLLLTSFHGAAWIFVGFVGVSSALLPAVGETFREWASGRSFVVPILLVMLATTAFSFQSNQRRGDLRTGSLSDETRAVRRAG